MKDLPQTDPTCTPAMIYGYEEDSRPLNEYGLKRLREVTLSVTADELRKVAAFLAAAADEMETGPVSIHWHRHAPSELRKAIGCDVIVSGPET